MMKILASLVLGGVILGQVPLVPQEMRWLHSYETVRFTNGDLGMNEYAVADAQGWYIRTLPADQAGVDYTTKRADINGKTEVQIVCEKCAYYSVFEDSRGQRVRVSEDGTKYRNLGSVKNAPRPSKTEVVALGAARRAGAAVAFDGASDEDSEVAASSISWSHTVTSNTNGYLAVASTVFDATDAERPVVTDGVTFNADILSVVKVQDDATLNHTVEWWGMVTPDQTTGTVQITYTGTVTDPFGGAISYTGVNQASPTGVTGGESDSNNDTPAISITTGTANSVMAAALLGSQATGVEVTADAPQTQRWGFLAGRNYGGADQTTTATGVYTSAWTIAGTGVSDWTLAAIEIKESVAAPAATGVADEGIIWFDD